MELDYASFTQALYRSAGELLAAPVGQSAGDGRAAVRGCGLATTESADFTPTLSIRRSAVEQRRY